MEKSAIVLAGGLSKRFGLDKGLVKLAWRPLILHVLDRVSTVVDEIVIVVGSESQEKAYAPFLRQKVKAVVDKFEIQSPLIGTLAGLESVEGRYSLLLPCDTPFISSQIMALLLELCVNNDAVIPQWPNDYLEPLQATYDTKSAIAATRKALKDGELNMYSMISRLKKVRYISTQDFERIDPRLMTFFNVSTPEDLKEAEHILQDVQIET